MTTCGVQQRVDQKILPVYMPAHQLAHPSNRRVQLASVKHGIFHASLPSIRQMDMDTATNKLPDEHSRTSTTCGPRDYARSSFTEFKPPAQKLHVMSSTPFGRQTSARFTPGELARHRQEWTDFVDHTPERFGSMRAAPPTSKDFHFTGYRVRYMKPSVSGSWNYTLRQEPNLDQHGQRPIPANIYARYRDSAPQYARNIATEAWRPF